MAKILIVEDEPIAQSVMKILLTSKLGHQVKVASSGMEALEKATKDVDFILMDIGLPDWGNEGGVKATKKIRAKGGHFAKIPIIALTANEDKELILKMIEAGADDYLNKPANQKQLAEIIAEFTQHPHAA
ncbi:MAG: hypothetical protein A3E87_03170 [Gammaproteobacteria bacterium RIFCSPHIGHO2_12_FULL_35_23]|nr:MAG: hypothetical protein A3E87_03170 [Gammaproteobacteria bacterium RIFCSPHIGHO2_12_FULL_35_23]